MSKNSSSQNEDPGFIAKLIGYVILYFIMSWIGEPSFLDFPENPKSILTYIFFPFVEMIILVWYIVYLIFTLPIDILIYFWDKYDVLEIIKSYF
jgi:hypothetical protein